MHLDRLFASAVLVSFTVCAAPARGEGPAPSVPSRPPPAPPPSTPPPKVNIDPRLLEGANFYRGLGRPDLAARYERRRKAKTGLRVVGTSILGVGAFVFLAEAATPSLGCFEIYTNHSGNCQRPFDYVPVGLMAAGLVFLVGSFTFGADPLNAQERAALLAAPPPAPKPIAFSAAIAPAPGGGAVLLGGRF